MAALDDELESDLPGYTRPRSVYETGEEPAAPVSALDGEDEEVGYGGGGDDLAGASATLARLRPAPAGSARAMLRQTLEQRLAERQAAPAAPAGFGVIGRDPAALERMIVPDADEVIYSRPEAEKPPEDTSSWTSILGRGLLRANEGLMQGKDIAEGKRPRTSKTEAAEYEKPMELADFLSPTTLAEKTVFSLAASYPAVALSIAGTLAGGAAGAAITGPAAPIGGTVGGIVGGAAGMGLGAAFQELGPAYHAELEALGENPTQEGIDKAWDNALVQVGKTGAVNAASMALLGAGKPLSNALKGLWTKPVLDAAGTAAPVVAGVPTRVGVQIVGQPAAAVGGEIAANVVQGKPLTENLDPAAAGSFANVAADVAAMAGGRLARGVSRRILRRGETTPGVSDDQKLALDATQPPGTQGELPLEGGAGVRPPPPVGPSGQVEMPLTGGAGERPPVQGEQLRLPDITGPGRQPLGDIVPPVRGPEPVQGQLPFGQEELPGMGRPPPTAGPPPSGPPPGGGPPSPPGGPGGQGELPLAPPVRPSVGPAEQLALTEPATQLPLPLATPEAPVPRPGPAQPEILGLGMPAARPGVQPELPGVAEPAGARMAPGEAARSPIGAVELPAEPAPSTRGPVGPPVGERTPEGWTTERDHTGPGYVVKNADGNVIAVGDTAAQAVEFARARAPEQVKAAAERVTERSGFTEEERVQAEQAKPATPGTKGQPISVDDLVVAGIDHEGRVVVGKKGQTHADLPGVEEDYPQMGFADRAGKYYSREEAAQAIRNGPTAEAIAEKNLRGGLEGNALVEAQKMPPAGAAKPEPAASGRDAAPETPIKKTPAEAVKAKGEARQAKKTAAEQIIADRKTEAEARVKRVTEKARQRAEAKKAAADETVTKPAEELRTETGPKKPPVTKSGGTEDQGTRTKSGAYVSPGEAAEPQAPRPAAKTQSDLSKEVAGDAARARREGLTSEATRRMAEVPTPTEKFSLTPGLETTRKARQVVENILAGQSLTDAIKAFGKKEPGTVGRPRNVQSLSSHIRQFLKEADTSTTEPSRQRALDATVVKLKKLGPEPVPGEASPQRRAILDDLNKQLKQLDQVRANRAKLEDAAAQIEALEAGSRGPKSIRRRITELVSRSTTPFEFLAKRREVNEPILQHIQRSGAAGVSLRRVLDDFIANKNANGMTPQLTELAQILRGIVPDTKVREGAGIIPDDAVGTYDPVNREIYLDTHTARQEGNAAVTLLHEAIHRPTVEYINYLYATPEANLNPQELAHKFAMDSIRGEIDRVYVEGGPRTHAEDFELGYAGEMYDTPYLTGPHELATQLLTQPELHRFLSRETASPEFRRALDSVGMGIGQKASIWDGFKRIVRNIFGVPDKLDSVFDYVLRPLTEIVETGAKFRRPSDVAEIRNTTRHNNEVLGPAKLRTPHSLRELKDAARALGGNIGDPKLRTALRGVFHTVTQDAYIDYIKPYIPAADAHREAHRRVGKAITDERVRDYTTYDENGKAIVEPHIDKTDRLTNQLRFGPDGDAAQELMTDITFAKADVLDPKADNSHVDPTVLADIQKRWADLDPAARQAARETFQVYSERDRASREAEVRQLAETAFPDMPRSQHDDIVRHMGTLGGVEDILANADRSALAQAVGPRWANSADLFRHLAENQRGGFVRGNYVPLNRFGEYVVSAGQANKPDYEVQMFERWSQAAAFRDKLKLERDDVSQLFVKSDSNFRQSMVPDQVLGAFDAAMAKAGITGDQAKVLREQYAGALIHQGMRQAQRSMKREYIAGASNEQARNLMMDFMSHTTRIGHLKHQGEVIRTLFQAEKENQELHRPGPKQGTALQVAVAQAGVDEMRRRLPPIDGDSSADQMGRTVRGITTLTLLDALVRPAKLAMDVAGTHAFALSMIGGKHGAVTAAAAVTKAYAQLTGATLQAAGRGAMAAIRRDLKAKNWMLSEVYRKRLHDADDISNEHADLLIDNLNAANLINQTHMSEVRRMAGPDGWLGANGRIAVVARLLDMNAAAEHAIDSAMRVGNAKAAFVTHLNANPGDVTGALAYGNYVARKSQPDWNFYNRSRLTTKQGALGQLGSVVTQFKSFGFHAYGVQGGLIVESVRKGGAERREALKTLALLHGSHALLWGGVGATLFNGVPMMAAMGIYDAINGENPNTNREWETWSRNYMHSIFGKTVADVYQNGLPTVAGINTSASLRFSNIAGVPGINTYDMPGFAEFGFKVATGASGSVVGKMAETGIKILGGDTSWERVTSLAPRIIEDPIKAMSWASGGMKSAKGDRVIVPAEQFTATDLIAKGLGFQPARASDASYARGAIDLAMDVREMAQEPLLKKLVKAVGDKRDTKEIMVEIKRFNDAVKPEDKITGQQIQQRLRAQAMANARPGLYGMQVPRRQYGKVEELTQFMRP